MTHEKLYIFTMPDELINIENMPLDYPFKKEVWLQRAKIEAMTMAKAISLNHPEINRQIEIIRLQARNKKMNKDGFEPGWQENIGAYAGGRREYDRLLREKGLVEIGYDTSTLRESTTTGNHLGNIVESAKDLGIELTGNEIEAIKSGEYFDASKCDLSGNN